MTAMFRIRDAMGRERWQEQPIDGACHAVGVLRCACEDDFEEIWRRRSRAATTAYIMADTHDIENLGMRRHGFIPFFSF